MGKHGGRTVRRWELGEIPVPGPVAVAVGLMLEQRNRCMALGELRDDYERELIDRCDADPANEKLMQLVLKHLIARRRVNLSN